MMSTATGFVSAINAYAATQYDSEYLGVNVDRLTGLASRVVAGAVSFEDASDEIFNRAVIALLAGGAKAEDLKWAVKTYASTSYDDAYKASNLERARSACRDIAEGRLTIALDEVKNRVLIARLG